MKLILMRLRITIAMLEIRNRETLQSKVNICKSDVKIGDYADSLLAGEALKRYSVTCTLLSLPWYEIKDVPIYRCKSFKFRTL